MEQQRTFVAELTALANDPRPFTDIRLEVDSPVAIRLPTGWVELDEPFPPDINDMTEIMGRIEGDWEEKIKVGAINRPFNLETWRLRINAFLAGRGKLAMSIRRIPVEPPTMKSVGLPGMTRVMLQAQRGLILISGATRSGKSTSAAAMLDAINETRAAHVITIEDPIEYVFAKKKAIFSQREIGADVDSFERGLLDAMRQCPEVILVGEIRNRETAETALLAGESGHLVIGTLHANTAVGAIQKMLGFFNDNERNSKVQALSSSLVGVVHQLLLPRLDGKGHALATEIINNYEQDFSALLGEPLKLQSAVDRPDCKGGRVSMADSLAALIKQQTISQADAMRAVVGMPSVAEKLCLQLA